MRKFPFNYHYRVDYGYWKYISLFSNPKYRERLPKELQPFMENSKSKFIRKIINKYIKLKLKQGIDKND